MGVIVMERFYRAKFDLAEQVACLYAQTGDPSVQVSAKRNGGAVEIFAEMVGGTAWTAVDSGEVVSLEQVKAEFETYARCAIVLFDLVDVARKAAGESGCLTR